MKKANLFMHRFISVLLTLCLITSVLCAQTLSADALSHTSPYDFPNTDPFIDIEDDSHLFISNDSYGADILGDDTLSLEQDRRRLTEVEVPYYITSYLVSVIGDNAYTGHTNLTEVIINSNIKKIGKYSFSGCTSLKNIYIPLSVTEIGDNAFNGCDKVVLNVGIGSYAEAYAIEHGLKYNHLNINDCKIYTYMGFNGAGVSIIKEPEGLYLERFKDYTFEYTTNEEEMLGTMTVTGIGVFTGTYIETTQLYPLYDVNNYITSLDQDSYTYDGTEKRPKVSVYSICYPEDILPPNLDIPGSSLRTDIPFGLAAAGNDDIQYNYLSEGKDYTVSYENNINIGTATVTVKGKGMYYGSAVKTFSITDKSLSNATVKIPKSSYTYTGSAIEPAVTVTDKGKELKEGEDYTVTYSDNINAGTAVALVKGIGNYSGNKSVNYTILKKDISDIPSKLSAEELSYTGSAQYPDVIMSYNGISLEKGKDYTLSYSKNVNVGTGVVTVNGIGNFSSSFTKQFTIKSNIKAISDCDIRVDKPEYIYDGNEKKPTVTVKYNSATLRLNQDYSISYSSNINAGSALVTITGKGNYTGAVSRGFQIKPKQFASTNIFRSKNSIYTYDGTEQRYQFEMIDGSKTLKEGVDYEVSNTNNINAGKAKLSINGIGNYDGNISITYNISPRSLSKADVVALPDSYLYDGYAKQPDVIVNTNGVTLKPGTDYTVAYSGNTEVGTAKATVTGIGNYTGTSSVNFSIASVSASEMDVELSGYYFTYNGKEQKPSVRVKYKNKELKSGTDYTVSYSDCLNVGNATVTITGKGHYSGIKKVGYMITQEHISNTDIRLSSNSYTYDGNAKTPSVTVTFGGKTMKKDADYTISYNSNTYIGTASAVIKGKGNFFGETSVPFEITGPPASAFKWKSDNWNFDNNQLYFSNLYYINDNIKQKFKSDYNISNTEMDFIEESIRFNNEIGGGFGGSCYGMTTTQMMAKYGYLDLTRYGGNRIVNKNSNTSDIISLINCFQYTYNVDGFNNVFRKLAFDPQNTSRQADYITALENALSDGKSMVNICFQIKALVTADYVDSNDVLHRKGDYVSFGGHSILGYGVESTKYTSNVTGLTYDRRILIADPNGLSYNNALEILCLYYRSSDHSWIIPYYNGPTGNNYQYATCYWNASSSLGIKTGYLYGLFDYNSSAKPKSVMDVSEPDHYIAGLTISSSSGEECSVEQLKSGNPYMAYAGENNNSGVAKYSDYSVTNESDPASAKENFALWNPSSSYVATYDNMTDIGLMMDYEKITYSANLSNANYTTFAASGYLGAQGDDTSYKLSMVTDDDMRVTDWYKITASGDGVDEVSLHRARGGYILSASNLKDVTVTAKNDIDEATCRFSVNYDSVFIYEINPTAIGLKVDTDNNGTYETALNVYHALLGDIDADGQITSLDATYIRRELAFIEIPFEMDRDVADANGDGYFDLFDVSELQRWLVKLSSNKIIGTPTDKYQT